jgi:hypothetical protein
VGDVIMCDKCAMHGDEKAEEKPVEYSQSYNTKRGGFTHLFLGEKGKTLLISWGVHGNPLSVSYRVIETENHDDGN